MRKNGFVGEAMAPAQKCRCFAEDADSAGSLSAMAITLAFYA